MVPNIVDRTAGVFLWVKLVVNDLLKVAFVPESTLLVDIKRLLERLPLELDEYYEYIINRMSPSHRWETYVLLELVSRSRDSGTPGLGYISGVIAVSECRTYKNATNSLFKDLKIYSLSNVRLGVRPLSGGLVEALKDPEDGRVYV